MDRVESSPEEGRVSVSDFDTISESHSRPRSKKALKRLKQLLIALLSLWGFVSIFMTILQRAPALMGYRVTPAHHGCYCGTNSK
jgi:hypothetical protein